jgi:3-oxoacyl-[acyl-carrier protein] reductase
VTEPVAAPLEGQVALVTGAGQGVGRQVALELGARGMAVALAAVSVEDLDEVAAELEANGGQALVVPSDVTDRASVQSLIGRVEGGLGPVDLLVTVAEGRGPALEFLASDPDAWWRALEVGLRGPALCSYYLLKRMMPRRRGRIVNLVGDWSLGPAPLFSEVACAEAALLRLTDSLALAAWTGGVSVFAVSAGRVAIEASPLVEGEAVERAPEGLQETGRLVAQLADGCADGLTGRFIHVDDDLEELLRRSDEVEADDLLQLRLLRLQPPPPAPAPEPERPPADGAPAEEHGGPLAGAPPARVEP